jgi:hypothetical protein
LTVSETAKLLAVDNNWVRDHASYPGKKKVRRPALPAIKLGKLLRFRPADLKAWIADLAQGA